MENELNITNLSCLKIMSQSISTKSLLVSMKDTLHLNLMQTKLQLTNSCLISVVKWVIHKPGDERGLAHALLSQEDKLELPQRVAGPEVCWRRHFWPCYCFLAKRPHKIARVWSLKHWKNALLGADSGQIRALGEGGRTVGWGALLRGRIQGASGSWKTLLKLFVANEILCPASFVAACVLPGHFGIGL